MLIYWRVNIISGLKRSPCSVSERFDPEISALDLRGLPDPLKQGPLLPPACPHFPRRGRLSDTVAEISRMITATTVLAYRLDQKPLTSILYTFLGGAIVMEAHAVLNLLGGRHST
jgi:hypothetical protein